ncbi:glutamate racemase [Thalassobacillus devorans]|uniref:glutamate racemase n=1 Tax=Thalassobacillus devorans TaxID=279813 RepID=UPI00048E976D|nr:glutamate racemase [Thalassobacillus devorans]
MRQAIGVIDSGVGGLTVARELMRQLPNEQLIYLGDTKRCPYGPRSKEEVVKFTWQMVNHLLGKNIKLLVVACNTATAFTLDQLQQKLDIPVIGVIQPGARAAIKVSKNKRVGVIGTEGTISSAAYTKALHATDKSLVVKGLACPAFVPMVEDGILEGEVAEETVKNSLHPLKVNNGIDTLILGCTHYPIIRHLIQREMGENIQVICSGEETAREVSLILAYQNLSYQGEEKPNHEFYSTGDLDKFEKVANMWFEEPIQYLKPVIID